MKILLLATHCNTGGITSYLLTLSKGFIERGHSVWLASSGGNSVKEFESLGVVHVRLNIKTKSELHPKVFLSLFPLKALIKKHGIEIIHAQTRVTQVAGHFLSKMTGVPMVTTCHGFFKPKWFRRKFPCWGDGVIAISSGVRLHLRKDLGVDNSAIHFIANGVDSRNLTPVTPEEKKKLLNQWSLRFNPVIGIIARLSDVKGIDVLIKAMPSVLKDFPNAGLMIVGEGPEQAHLKALRESLKLQNNIRFEPIVSQTKSILPLFDVFVMPSLQEGLGLSVMEAQACGIPVVVSNVGGLPDLVSEDQTGFLVPPRDENALASAIVRMLKDPVHAMEMANAARENIEENFSATGMVEATINVYEQYSRR